MLNEAARREHVHRAEHAAGGALVPVRVQFQAEAPPRLHVSNQRDRRNARQLGESTGERGARKRVLGRVAFPSANSVVGGPPIVESCSAFVDQELECVRQSERVTLGRWRSKLGSQMNDIEAGYEGERESDCRRQFP